MSSIHFQGGGLISGRVNNVRDALQESFEVYNNAGQPFISAHNPGYPKPFFPLPGLEGALEITDAIFLDGKDVARFYESDHSKTNRPLYEQIKTYLDNARKLAIPSTMRVPGKGIQDAKLLADTGELYTNQQLF